MSTDSLAHKQSVAARRRVRTRRGIYNHSQRARLSVHISNKHISAQIIDDSSGKTLVSSTTIGRAQEGSMTQAAEWVGADIAKKATKAKIGKVVLDSGSRIYHGRIKSLADAARQGGLNF